MGQQLSTTRIDPVVRREFVKKVLTDLQALEAMLDAGVFETGIRRIGAEQELVFVDAHGRPAPVGMEMLERLGDGADFTTELSLFNLEVNLPPLELRGNCLSHLHRHLVEVLDHVRTVGAEIGAHPILTGILPTLRKLDLGMENITPRPRYLSLVKVLREARGHPYEFRFTGADELVMRHDSVMLEACNTSSQFHLQVAPDEFAAMYNISQAIAGPVLAAAVNSPLLFGRRLWKETRIALFQQAVDTRPPSKALQERSGRVRFGEAWVESSALELFQQDVARFRVLLAEEVEEDSLEVLARGGIPKLSALQLHNGTIYRWNRACYGITDGRPHLRIENRVFPSGPTIVDEVANAALWFGLMLGTAEILGDVRHLMSFDDARSNFLNAARLGLDAPIIWPGLPPVFARELILDQLLPLAFRGLADAGVDAADADHYLGIIERRVDTRRTGARWQLASLAELDSTGRTRAQRMTELVGGLYARQKEDRPVHEWTTVKGDDDFDWIQGFLNVDQFMTTAVFTVRDDDVIDLAASIMDWEHIRHVPVEDADRRLVGLISYRQLLRFLARDLPHGREHPVPAHEVMQRDPITVSPDTPTLDAMNLMRERRIPCLPVVREDRLVGILTDRDFLPVAARLLQDRLGSK